MQNKILKLADVYFSTNCVELQFLFYNNLELSKSDGIYKFILNELTEN